MNGLAAHVKALSQNLLSNCTESAKIEFCSEDPTGVERYEGRAIVVIANLDGIFAADHTLFSEFCTSSLISSLKSPCELIATITPALLKR